MHVATSTYVQCSHVSLPHELFNWLCAENTFSETENVCVIIIREDYRFSTY